MPPRRTPSIAYRPMVPDVPGVTSVLGRSNALSSLMQRLRMSQDCLEAVRACLKRLAAAGEVYV